jgi:hypothetical protein
MNGHVKRNCRIPDDVLELIKDYNKEASEAEEQQQQVQETQVTSTTDGSTEVAYSLELVESLN